MARTRPIFLVAALAVCFVDSTKGEYFGKFIGKLSELHHGVSGEVYAVDGRTIYIKDYTYDGQGPYAYFYASTYKTPDSRGFRLRDENNNGDVIKRYRKEGVTLTLPEGKTLNNIKIFYVWCEEFDVNFGDVKIPRNFDYPRPQKIDALKGVHSISSDNIVIVDAQTLLIPNLHYDGDAPDGKFWAGRGPKPSPQGVRVPDENGKELPLRRYDGKTVVLTLPGDLTVFDIGHFGIWCEQFTVDFGHVQIPQNLNVPPSLKMLGVSPQSKLNCEVLDETLAFEVRWAVAGESIVIQLVSKLDGREYMSFGLSGDVSKSIMIGGDVVVAWVDKDTLKGYAEDYHLADKAQCSGPTGSCPDNKFAENTNNIRLLNAAMVNGYSIVTYQRPLKASDQYDLPIYTNQSQAIIWAVGPLNQRDEVSFHTSYLKKDNFIDFARPAKWNCPLPQNDSQNRQLPPIQTKRPEITDEPSETVEYKEISTSAPRRDTGTRRRGSNRGTSRPATTTEATTKENQILRREPTRTRGSTTKSSQRVSQAVPPTPTPVNSRDAWYIPPIECYEPEDGVFYAQMGPTGGKRGYPAITGHVGWGISWYINGLLIPEINVVRGKTYNFITEGGENPEISAKYHPFYITDDPIGGYSYKSPEEKKNITIFAGVRYEDGEAIPTGTGRLCHWTQTGEKDADDFESFGAYQRTLQLKCDVGEPGVVTWTPDSYTPDTVYYQCFTHRYLGWKINVHDTCEQAKASELQISIAERPADFQAFSDSSLELEASPSIRQETRVMPNRIIIEEITSDNWSQHAVSEVPTTTLDPITTPIIISQKKSDLLTPNTSFFLPKTPHNFFIDSNNRRPNFDQTNGDFLRKQVITTERSITTRKLNQPLVYIKPNLKNPLYPSFKKPVYKQRRVRPYSSSGSKIQLHKNVFNTPIRPQLSQTPIFAQKPIKHVEISPQQASTEREPNLQNSGLSTFIRQSSEEKSVTYQTPKNKGFDPDSIVIEGGFKPIIAKRADDRIDLEIDSEGQSGVIDVKQKKNFIRTPIGHEIVKVIIRSRSLIDSDVEPEMAAAEREEVYYLPPPGPIAISKSPNLPSELDFEAPAPPDTPTVTKDAVSPPDVVVTFDGKRVSGASLTAKPFDKAIVLQRGSKATELLRGHPQSVPFRGDLPPLDPNVLFKENSAAAPNTGVLNRNLDTPLLTSGTTKLQRVRRRAHHTPEHTAQQKQEKPYQNQAYKANSTCFVLVLGAFLLKIVS